MKRTDCTSAEILAGAIALGEANDAERDDYRRHVATCANCLQTNGGEREIERVMATIARARDEESWEPDLRAALRDRTRLRRAAWQLGVGGGIAAALAVSFGIHAMLATGVRPIALAPQIIARNDAPFHVTLETRPKAPPPAIPRAAQTVQAPAISVVHNVVSVTAKNAGPTVRHATAPAAAPIVIAALPPSLRDERAIAAMGTTSQTMPPAYAHQAESIAIAPREIVVRDASPLGTMPAPNLPSIVAREMASEGLSEVTTVYVVAIDERGAPTSCTVEQPSGIVAIDQAVCRAAMKARFTPRTINGRPAAGTFRDAYVVLAG